MTSYKTFKLLDNCSFRYSCENGYLKNAQRRYSLENIDIHAHDDYIFRNSCIYGHLNIAQWLHSLGSVNIHAYSDYAFRQSCAYGCLEVVLWLTTICSEYEIISVSSSTITYKINISDTFAWFKNIKAILFVF